MKFKLVILLLLVASTLSSFKPFAEQTILDGVWELKEFNYGGNKGSNPSPRNVKVFENGNFTFYLVTEKGSRKTIEGKFKVVSESLYTETIVKAVNTPMIGKTYWPLYRELLS